MSTRHKYNRLPHAGDSEIRSGVETVYLSPKPVPTGMPPFSARQLHRDTNDVYLDFAVGRANFEFMARAGIGSVMFITLFFLFVSGFGSWLRRDVQPFWTSWIDFFTNAFVQGFIWCLTAVYVVFFAMPSVRSLFTLLSALTDNAVRLCSYLKKVPHHAIFLGRRQSHVYPLAGSLLNMR